MSEQTITKEKLEQIAFFMKCAPMTREQKTAVSQVVLEGIVRGFIDPDKLFVCPPEMPYGPLAQFVKHMEAADGGEFTASDLYARYRAWCEECPEAPILSLSGFGQAMGGLGVTRKKKANANCYVISPNIERAE